MIAGLAYAFCPQTVQQGRVATADALTIFFMTLTAFAGWQLIVHPPASRGARTYFWDTSLALGFAGGFLAKGPEALLPLVPLLFSARKIRRGAVPELFVNFFLGLVIVLFWAIPAWVMTNGDYWRVGLSEGIGQRVITGLQGHGASTFGWYLLSLPLYLLLFWISALPWSPLLLTHRQKLFGAWKPDPLEVFLLLNAGLIFVIFSLMVTKLPHYTLPAFPFLTLLLARRWTSAGLHPALPTQLAIGMGILFALLTAVLAPIGLAHGFSPSPAGSLVRQADGAITPDTRFALVDFQEPNAVWEMRRVTKAYAEPISEADVLAYLDQPGPRAIVLSTPLWERIKPASHNADASWTTYEAGGWNTARGWDSAKGTPAFVDLTLVVKK
jgi:4-amino-4-deoxy-L-arabinose transferase-like glycosyltransferase